MSLNQFAVSVIDRHPAALCNTRKHIRYVDMIVVIPYPVAVLGNYVLYKIFAAEQFKQVKPNTSAIV